MSARTLACNANIANGFSGENKLRSMTGIISKTVLKKLVIITKISNQSNNA